MGFSNKKITDGNCENLTILKLGKRQHLPRYESDKGLIHESDIPRFRVCPSERFLDPPPPPLLSILYMTIYFQCLN